MLNLILRSAVSSRDSSVSYEGPNYRSIFINKRPKGHKAQPKMHYGIERAGVTLRNCKVKELIMERGHGKNE